MDLFASEVQYVSHVAPIWHALEPSERGLFHVTTDRAHHEAIRQGIPKDRIEYDRPRGEGNPVVLASFSDYQVTKKRPIVLLEHGSGQTYQGITHPSYSGGDERDRVALFLCPSKAVADRNGVRYPNASRAVIGAPVLDKFHTRPFSPEPNTIAISTHWECPLVPETRSALAHFVPALPEVCERFHVLGHAHPRIYSRVKKIWEKVGAEPVEHFDEVMERAQLYVCDNSSTLVEFASTGRPIVFLSAPWYRREVEHGGRFWDWPKGQIHVEEPGDLLTGIAQALSDPPQIRQARERMVQTVYAHTDGLAAHRAAEAIREVFGG